MAKVKVHLRVAKKPTFNAGSGRYQIEASTKPNYKPLTRGSGYSQEYLPTIAFAVELDIPDEAFKQAEQVIAEITVPADVPVIAAEVQPSEEAPRA